MVISEYKKSMMKKYLLKMFPSLFWPLLNSVMGSWIMGSNLVPSEQPSDPIWMGSWVSWVSWADAKKYGLQHGLQHLSNLSNLYMFCLHMTRFHHCHSQAPVHEGSQQLSALCLWRLGEPLRHWIVRGMKEGFASSLFSVLTVLFDFDLMLCLHFQTLKLLIVSYCCWLVVSTPWTYISQWEHHLKNGWTKGIFQPTNQVTDHLYSKRTFNGDDHPRPSGPSGHAEPPMWSQMGQKRQ